MASNRSPSPLTPRTCRNSETNSATRRSFNGSPFARPNPLVNPKSANPSTVTDQMKRNSTTPRKSFCGGSMFQDGKENQKDSIRSPSPAKGFMAPTISAASKFTPSPRKKILGEKNDILRTSVQFVDKDRVLKPVETAFDDQIKSTVAVETPNVGDEVTLSSTTDEKEMVSDVTEDTSYVRVRPFCCSPVTSPIIAPVDSDHSLPPYDPKNNFLSPRPQFLRYKPNPRIDALLNKDGSDEYGDDNEVTRLDDSFSLTDSSSDTEEEVEVHEEEKNEAELLESFHGSSEVVSEIVSEEKESETEVEKVTKPRFFTRSKTVSFVFLMFLVACFSVSFTDLPPMDLPIYEEVGFKEVYHESLKFVAFAKESFDDVVLHVKQWSIDFVSYLSDQKSQFFATREISSIQFYNLTVSPPQEEFVFNRHIGTDYIHEVQEVEEELAKMEMMEEEEEENYEEMEVDDDFDEVVTEEVNEIETDEQIHGDDMEAKSDLEDVFVIKSEVLLETQTEMLSNDPEIESISSVDPVPEAQPNMLSNDPEVQSTESGSVDPVPEAPSEVVTHGPKIQSSSETLSSLLSQSINTIYLAGVSMVIMAAASAIIYMKKRKTKAIKPANVRVTDDDMCSESCSAESSSVQKGIKKKSGYNKRESLASSSTDLSMGSPSYGSFTTYERIPIKHGEEVLMTPIRRSSRLNKSQVTSS
ncbi:hypothetical protein CTI12_AA453600 [Artemisia annua]|uniref:Transmembrane protein n=1 Tax=Artemisia annua TaxID=35608 RepID=A0A2U1LMR3_ARTAN|nr:hypothetical protein CTI12_AA453600 [Artemisia annua]